MESRGGVARMQVGRPLICYLPGVLCLVAILSLPYPFYNLLRLVVFGAAIAIIYLQRKRPAIVWSIVFAGIAILFNPIIPIHQTRAEWLPLDLASGAAFIVYGRWWGARLSC